MCCLWHTEQNYDNEEVEEEQVMGVAIVVVVQQ